MIEDVRKFEDIKQRLETASSDTERSKILEELNNFEFHDEIIEDNFFYTLKYEDGKIKEDDNKGFLLFNTVPVFMIILLSFLPMIFSLDKIVHIVSILLMMALMIVFIFGLAFNMGEGGVVFIHKYLYPNDMSEEELEALDRNLAREVNSLEEEVRNQLIDDVIRDKYQ